MCVWFCTKSKRLSVWVYLSASVSSINAVQSLLAFKQNKTKQNKEEIQKS